MTNHWKGKMRSKTSPVRKNVAPAATGQLNQIQPEKLGCEGVISRHSTDFSKEDAIQSPGQGRLHCEDVTLLQKKASLGHYQQAHWSLISRIQWVGKLGLATCSQRWASIKDRIPSQALVPTPRSCPDILINSSPSARLPHDISMLCAFSISKKLSPCGVQCFPLRTELLPYCCLHSLPLSLTPSSVHSCHFSVCPSLQVAKSLLLCGSA